MASSSRRLAGVQTTARRTSVYGLTDHVPPTYCTHLRAPFFRVVPQGYDGRGGIHTVCAEPASPRPASRVFISASVWWAGQGAMRFRPLDHIGVPMWSVCFDVIWPWGRWFGPVVSCLQVGVCRKQLKGGGSGHAATEKKRACCPRSPPELHTAPHSRCCCGWGIFAVDFGGADGVPL